MKDPFCITFAGVIGSSKTPIAHHLSWNLGLPVFCNDTLRTEVKEDRLEFDQVEYRRRRDERCKQLISRGRSFIYDASVDREWTGLNDWLQEKNYRHFIISLDLSRELLDKIYESKGYEGHHLEQLLSQHQNFIANHGDQIGLHITDQGFEERLNVSLLAVKSWLN